MKVLERPTTPPPPHPDLALDREWRDDAEVDVFSGVLLLWRSRVLVLGGTLLGAAIAFVAAMFVPSQYTAVSTVFISIPRAVSELAPEPLSMESYDRLANSDLVRGQIETALKAKGLLGSGNRLTNLRTVLYPSREPQKPYLPLLGLSVSASTPELAREASNTWASVLVEEERKMSAAGRSTAVDFLLNEYPKASGRLTEKERNLEAVKRDQGRALSGVKTRAAITLKEAELWSREATIVELEQQLSKHRLEAKEAQLAVLALEEEIKQIPQLITVAKAITDEALWQSVTKNGGKPGAEMPGTLADARLRSQEVNPVYTEVARQLAEARVRRNTLAPQEQILAAEIARARRDAAALRAELARDERTIDEMEAAQKTELAERERDVQGARNSYKKLEERIGDAELIRAIRDSSLRIGSPAELPASPSGPKVARAVGLAGLCGFFLSAGAAWIMNRARGAASAR